VTRKRRAPAARLLLPPLAPLAVLAEDFSRLVRRRRTRPCVRSGAVTVLQ
jgi:hypothetical protein